MAFVLVESSCWYTLGNSPHCRVPWGLADCPGALGQVSTACHRLEEPELVVCIIWYNIYTIYLSSSSSSSVLSPFSPSKKRRPVIIDPRFRSKNWKRPWPRALGKSIVILQLYGYWLGYPLQHALARGCRREGWCLACGELCAAPTWCCDVFETKS